jgi:EmrB/QacA subfamily drug resistance transporter
MATGTATDKAQTRGPARLGVLVGPLLTMIDSSIVTVATPDIARELRAPLSTTQWVVSGYLLALAAGLTTTSYLARRFGTMRVYRAALAGFLLASAACAAVPGIGALIAARACQGLLGAPLVPLAMSLLLGRQGAARRIPVSAGVLFFVAPAIGPSFGGLLIAAGGWRWIFLINVPVGVLGLLGQRGLPAAPAAPGARFDPIGLALLSVGLVGTLYGASRGTVDGWSTPAAVTGLAAGGMLLLAYAVWGLRVAHAAVDLTLLRHGRSALALGLSVLSSVVAFAAVFLLPVFTQTVQHHSAFATGLALLPQGLITGIGTALGQRIGRRIGVRALVCSGFLVLAVASAGLLVLTRSTPLWVTAAILSGRAAAIGLGITPLLSVMLEPLGDDRIADGNTLFNIAQRLGGSLGVGVLGSLLAARAARVGPVAGFHQIGVLLAVLALVAAALAALLPDRKSLAAA